MTSEGFKETEIGMLPKAWDVKTLKDISEDVSYGYTASATKEKLGPKFLRITDIVPPIINWSEVPFCVISDEDKIKYKLEVGDIVIARTGANTGFNSIFKVDIEAVFASYLIRFRIDRHEAHPFFVSYMLKSKLWDFHVEGVIGGSAQPGANARRFGEFKLPIPPLGEQKSIADFLLSIDRKIELNQEMNRTLEAIGQAIFRHWFVHYEFPNEEGQPYKSSGGEMVESELGEIPKGWEVIDNIAEKCDLINYGYTQSASEEVVGPKFLRVMDINKGDWINWDTVPYCEIDKKQLTKYRLEKGDIVIARMADPGKVAIFESDIDAVFASYLIRIRLLDPKYSYYFYYLMKSPYYQYYIVGASSGTVQSNLNAKGLTKGLSIIIPDINTINSFNMTIGFLRKKINDNIAETQNLSQIRDSLLPKLMSGKIRVNPQEEATAK